MSLSILFTVIMVCLAVSISFVNILFIIASIKLQDFLSLWAIIIVGILVFVFASILVAIGFLFV